MTIFRWSPRPARPPSSSPLTSATQDVKSLDARDYLKHFLDTAPVAGRLQTGDSSKQRASARFRDEEGDNWFVRFISNGANAIAGDLPLQSSSDLARRQDRSRGSGLDQVEGAGVSLHHGSIESFFLEGEAGRLEALLNLGLPDAPYACVVCHPHPLFGGTMHNKVVFHAMKALNAFGFPVLRFNFRGVGASAGEHDYGRGEIADVESRT